MFEPLKLHIMMPSDPEFTTISALPPLLSRLHEGSDALN